MDECPVCHSVVGEHTIALGTFSSVFDNCWPPCSIKPRDALVITFFVCNKCEFAFTSKKAFAALQRDVEPKNEQMKRHQEELRQRGMRVSG